jgi:hypothetical protein
MEIKYTTKYNIGDEVWVKHYVLQYPIKTIISKLKIHSIDLYVNNGGKIEESYYFAECYGRCYIANTVEESFDKEYAILREDQIEDVIDFHKRELDIDVEWIK